MKPERIIEEMARLDGFLVPNNIKFISFRGMYALFSDVDGKKLFLPNYLTDEVSVQRVIIGLTSIQRNEYARQLTRLICPKMKHYVPPEKIIASVFVESMSIMVDVKCEAILRAMGRWEE